MRRRLCFSRDPDQIDDAQHARNIAHVELGAGALIGQVNNPGRRHPAVLNVNFEPVSRNPKSQCRALTTRIRTSSLCDSMFCLLPHTFAK